MSTLWKQPRSDRLAGLLLLVLLPLLVIDFSFYSASSPRFVAELLNLAHIPLFLLIGYWISGCLSRWADTRPITRPVRIIYWIGLSAALAVLTELLQTFTENRFLSWTDLRRDSLGLGLFLVSSSQLLRVNHARRRWLLSLTLLWLLVELIPVTRFMLDYTTIRCHPHILSNFETIGQASRWNRGELLTTEDPNRLSVLKVPLGTQRYEGTSLEHLPRDWSRWSTLHVEVFNADGSAQKLHFKFDDYLAFIQGYLYSLSFNATVSLRPGWNKIDIPLERVRNGPLERTMNMTEIFSVTLFHSRRKQPGFMLLDNLYLE
ncbi:MAG: VanZ family protein [Gammaproteobacteria bacterium]